MPDLLTISHWLHESVIDFIQKAIKYSHKQISQWLILECSQWLNFKSVQKMALQASTTDIESLMTVDPSVGKSDHDELQTQNQVNCWFTDSRMFHFPLLIRRYRFIVFGFRSSRIFPISIWSGIIEFFWIPKNAELSKLSGFRKLQTRTQFRLVERSFQAWAKVSMIPNQVKASETEAIDGRTRRNAAN